MRITNLEKPAFGMKRGIAVLLVLFCLTLLAYLGCSGGNSSGNQLMLARVEVPDYLEDIHLPVYADLEDGQEVYYALVIASKEELEQAGVTYRIIDSYTPGTRYIIAQEDIEGAREEAANIVNILYDDGEHIIVRFKADLTELLPDLGFDIKLMSKSPINVLNDEVISSVKSALSAKSISTFEKNSDVEKMIAAVTQTDLKDWTDHLSGEKQVEVNGNLVTLTSRHTYQQGTQVQNATQYVYDQMKAMGIGVSFSGWSVAYGEGTLDNRNVVGEIKGKTTPEEIVVLIAHLDTISKNENGIEPGADDNGSGCVGLLAAADIMRYYSFKRTVRFVFTTGEEQSLYGGTAYAEKMDSEGQNIVAVLNLDMIGYSKITDPAVKPKQQIKIRNQKNKTGYAKDLPIAQTYIDVVNAYGMNQIFDAVIEDDGEVASDHAPFWDLMATCLKRNPNASCYPAAWVIEYAEEGYLNPKMHSAEDRVSNMNLPYFTAVVKAALGTAVHLAQPTL